MPTSASIIRRYLILTLLSTLASSFIWGINTLFLLDAGLSNTEAFTANAFYTIGMVLFEVPTGVVADTKGRRASYLLGVITLLVTTVGYYFLWVIKADFIWWAIVSLFLGLGFTFFSGAVEAWLVDALEATGFKGQLDTVFARNQLVSGIAMLTGSVAGGVIAQFTDLGVPYLIRSLMLVLSFIFAILWMKDLGFTPETGRNAFRQMQVILKASFDHGLKQPTVRNLMLAAPFSMGVLTYAFYAMQPYFLELYGNPNAYSIAGLAAAIVAGAQMLGSIVVPRLLKLFRRRTSMILLSYSLSALLVFIFGLVSNFYFAIFIAVVWAMVLASAMPVRQSLMNKLIPSKQRATVLSFDALMGSTGGVFSQPLLGRSADIWSYGISYLICAVLQLIALPFTLRARQTCNHSDWIDHKK